jgi:hypothetical protein
LLDQPPPAEVTHHIVLLTSSAIKGETVPSMASPTGRLRNKFSLLKNVLLSSSTVLGGS